MGTKKTSTAKKPRAAAPSPAKSSTAKKSPAAAISSLQAAAAVAPKPVKLSGRGKTVSSKTVFQGNVFWVTRDEVEEPGGVKATRDVIRHNGSVVVLAVDTETNPKDPGILLIRQYRHAAGKLMLELPAGRIEPGEKVIPAGKRELIEETGYRARRWSHHCNYYASPGFLTETMTILLAEGLTQLWTTSPSPACSTKPPRCSRSTRPTLPHPLLSPRRRGRRAADHAARHAGHADADPKALLAIPGIGKGMAANIRDLVATGTMPLREELLPNTSPRCSNCCACPAWAPRPSRWSGPRWGLRHRRARSAAKRAPAALPRMGEKFTAKLLKGIEDYRRNSGRFRIDVRRASTPSASPNSSARFPASTRSPPPAPCAAAARPSATSTCSSPAPPASPTSSPRLSSMSPRCR
jgi:ADP-ribose pyrophosphatase